MLKALRKRAMRTGAIFFVASGAMFLAWKKLLNDQFADDETDVQQELKNQQQQRLGNSSDNLQLSTATSLDVSELERELIEFQEFKRFQEQKRLHEQQQAAGNSASKAP
jgi:hypothetical protein